MWFDTIFGWYRLKGKQPVNYALDHKENGRQSKSLPPVFKSV